MVSPNCLPKCMVLCQGYATWIFVVRFFSLFAHERMKNDYVNTNQIWTYPKCLSAWRQKQMTDTFNSRQTHKLYMRSFGIRPKLKLYIYWTKWLEYIFTQKRLNSEFNYLTFSPVAFDIYAIICQKWMDLFIKNDEMQMNRSISFSSSTWHMKCKSSISNEKSSSHSKCNSFHE